MTYRRNDFYLEHLGPLLAGDKEAVALDVVGDAVQDGFGVDALAGGQDTAEVDPAGLSRPHSKAGTDSQHGQQREGYGDILQHAQGLSSGDCIV
jgi:hypothetical protein